MAQDNCQKIKLLKLLELLLHETDEQHPLPTNTLCAKLGDMGITCDRRTLAKDIALLNDQGYEVMWTWVGKEKGYYIEDRSFSVPELNILIDAVQAASFITDKKTAELIDKIADLGGSHRADIMKSNMVCFNTRKHSNEAIYYNVGFLEDAIQQQKKVIFYYYDLNENGEKVYRRQGHHYVVEPVALVFMEKVEIIEDSICEKALVLRDSIGGYTEQAFKMYGGQLQEITIQFENCLIGSVYDKFGEDTQMHRISDTVCETTVAVQISPIFWGWIFQFGKLMRITDPENIVCDYDRIINDMCH